jgi:glutamyl-tRNA reductase
LPIIGKGTIERALHLRKNHPLFIIDVAVPRDVEPEVNELADVYLYCIDDLQSIASKNQQSRQEAAVDAEAIVESQVSNFLNWIDTDTGTKTVVDFRTKFGQIRDDLLQQALYQMQQGRDPKQVVAAMANALTNKLLHAPTINIKRAALNKNAEHMNVVKELFNL